MTTKGTRGARSLVGDGIADDTDALQWMIDQSLDGLSAVVLAAGRYKITRPLVRISHSKIAIRGAGDNVSVIVAHETSAMIFHFGQVGQDQPHGVRLLDIGFEAVGRCGTAIAISYGNPVATTDHSQASTVLRNVSVVSGPGGSWSNGLDIEAAWNVTMSDVYVSGSSAAGVWNNLAGDGIRFRRMCVNAHLVNVRCNFWSTGLRYDAAGGGNTEGLFCSNCSMVGVKRGVWITGNPDAAAPRVSTLTWTGGMIECRVTGVADVSAAFYLEHVWTAMITAVQCLAESVPTEAGKNTYGFLVVQCAGVVVNACDINAWNYGFHTALACKAIAVTNCTFTNAEKQVIFAPGCEDSRSYGHVRFNNDRFEWSASETNKLGFL